MAIKFSPGPCGCCPPPTPPDLCCGGNPPSKAQLTFNGYQDYTNCSPQPITSGCGNLNGAFLCRYAGGCSWVGPIVSFQIMFPQQTINVAASVSISSIVINGVKKYLVRAGWNPIDSAFVSDMLDPFDCSNWGGSIAGSTPGEWCRPCSIGCPDNRIPDPHGSGGSLACPVSCEIQFIP